MCVSKQFTNKSKIYIDIFQYPSFFCLLLFCFAQVLVSSGYISVWLVFIYQIQKFFTQKYIVLSGIYNKMCLCLSKDFLLFVLVNIRCVWYDNVCYNNINANMIVLLFFHHDISLKITIFLFLSRFLSHDARSHAMSR